MKVEKKRKKIKKGRKVTSCHLTNKKIYVVGSELQKVSEILFQV